MIDIEKQRDFLVTEDGYFKFYTIEQQAFLDTLITLRKSGHLSSDGLALLEGEFLSYCKIYAAKVLEDKERETKRADAWVSEVRALADKLGLSAEDSNGSIADWKFIKKKLGDKEREIAELKNEVIEKCAKVCESSDRHRGEYFATKIRALKT